MTGHISFQLPTYIPRYYRWAQKIPTQKLNHDPRPYIARSLMDIAVAGRLAVRQDLDAQRIMAPVFYHTILYLA